MADPQTQPNERRRPVITRTPPYKLDARHWLVDISDPDEKSESGKPVARAVVMKSSRALSKLKPPQDPAKDLYGAGQIVEPYLKPNIALHFANTCSIHGLALQRKARVIAGLGIKPVARESERELRQITRKWKRKQNDPLGKFGALELDENDAADAEKKLERIKSDGENLKEWIEEVGGDTPLREILERCWYDYECFGWFCMEIVRDGAGKIAQIAHVPAHLVRRTKDYQRFVYLKTPTVKIYYKPFEGDKFPERHLNAQSGEYKDEPLQDDFEANEMLFWCNYSPNDPYYGAPIWFSAMSEILGSNEARDFMLFYFTRRATPTYAVLLEGGAFGTPQLSEIRNFFRKDLLRDYHATLVMEVPEGGKVTFERMTEEPRWVILVQQYLSSLRDAIVSAHGLSPAIVGVIETAHLGGGSSDAQLEIFKSIEARPKQESLENILNNLLVRKGLGIKTQILKLDELDVRDEAREVQAVSTLFAGAAMVTVITLNEARKRLRLDPVNEEWADEILVRGGASGITPLSMLELPEQEQMGGAFGGMPFGAPDQFGGQPNPFGDPNQNPLGGQNQFGQPSPSNPNAPQGANQNAGDLSALLADAQAYGDQMFGNGNAPKPPKKKVALAP